MQPHAVTDDMSPVCFSVELLLAVCVSSPAPTGKTRSLAVSGTILLKYGFSFINVTQEQLKLT